MTDESLVGLSKEIQFADLRPSELLEAYLGRIKSLDGELNTFIQVMEDRARESAAASETRLSEGRPQSPLEGLGVGVKDLLNVAGVPTTNGIAQRHVLPADNDAEAVRRLSAAGAVVVGKLNMHEAALGSTNDNPHFGRCHNPWRAGVTPGGSSGGSAAAVAAGLCAGALGSDNMGSIRIPAAFCGIAGLKPTYGLISTLGMVSLSWSTGTIGPMARGVDGLNLMMEVLAGYDEACEDSRRPPEKLNFSLPGKPSIKGRKLGVLHSFIEGKIAPAVNFAFQEALKVLENLGAELVPVELEELDAARSQCLLIIEAEGAQSMATEIADPNTALSSEVRQMLVFGRDMPARKLAGALHYRHRLRHRVGGVFERVEALLTPTTPTGPFPFEQGAPANLAEFMALANLCGLPALSVPMGLSGEGLPLGLQIMAPQFHDPQVLQFGRAYELATDWHLLRPPLPASA